jgi:uncharacterized damage-inducible protein DinB
MSESKRLAKEIEKALNGEAWHGPSWRENLEGLSREAATRRPIPEAHTIAEVLLHATTWNDVVRRRIQGESPKVSDAENWPVAAFSDDAAWSTAVARFFETGKALVATIERFPDARLEEKRPNVDGTWYELVSGQLQHALYHAGQVGLLKKASVQVGV